MIHLKVIGVDCRNHGQTDFEHSHQAACGYVRNNVTTNINDVGCFFCKRTDEYKSRINALDNNEE